MILFLICTKLSALRRAERNLKQELSENNRVNDILSKNRSIINNKVDNTEMSDINKLNAYRYEIQKTRQERNKEMKTHKILTEKIIETWKEIKDLRTKQQFKNTDIKLIIKKYFNKI